MNSSGLTITLSDSLIISKGREEDMKKLVFLILILSLFLYCGPKEEEVDRIMEDGVEVVINHLEPYKIKGAPSKLSLEMEFSIDTEQDEILDIGLTQIYPFDVDNQGNIYCMDSSSENNIIFKFDRMGNFVNSLIRKGQGPDEIQMPFYFRIDKQNEFVIMDHGKEHLLILTDEGKEQNRFPIASLDYRIEPLNNGKYLLFTYEYGPSENEGRLLILCDANLEQRKELEKLITPSPYQGKQAKGTPYMFICCNSEENIYVAAEGRGYEIWVYDLDGNLIRKIRKEYNPVEVSEEYKKYVLENVPEQVKRNLYFPQHWPPLQYMFADDDGHLLAMTYEPGIESRHFVYDIFNKDGAFIGRKSLDNYAEYSGLEETPLLSARKRKWL
jgi:hypothetical protein